MMDRKRIFNILTYLIVSLFLVNLVAVKLYWYYTIWYFDMITHFLGGFCMGLLVIWIFSSETFFKNSFFEFSLKSFYEVILGVLIIGVGWEFFEILVNNVFAKLPFNILDTLSDILFDLAGGTLAMLYVTQRIMFRSRNNV